jgi:hemolysin activation/secretion protein
VWFVDGAGFPGGAADDTIAGAGVGVRLRAGEGFTLKVDAARAIGERSAADEPGVVHFSVNQRW